MKKLANLFLLFALVPMLIFTNCKNTEEEVNQYSTLTEYLETEGMDLNHIISNADGVKFVYAPASEEDVANRYIIDIRSASDYAAGRIEGAHNYAFSDILTAAEEAAAAGQQILVVCYTGQTACYATSLLRLAGYDDAQALKWGMSGWNQDFDKWTDNVSDVAEGSANWTNAAAPANAAYGNPLIVTEGADGAAILQARIEAVIAEGFQGVAASAVVEAPGDYFINNYFSEADYLGFGHIDGAHRISPLLLSDGSMSYLDPDAKVVTYCYTGQTSAIITAYLRVIGYDAYSLKFGMNGLYHSNGSWASNQWGGDSNPKEFGWVETY